VLAFVAPHALGSTPPDLLSCLCAQLRGLGASLFVVSEQAWLCLRPEGELSHVLCEPADIIALCRAWDISPAALRAGALSALVMDARGRLRHRQNVLSHEEPLLLLARCLTQSLRELDQRIDRSELTRNELYAASLASGISAVLSASGSPLPGDYASPPPQPTAAPSGGRPGQPPAR